MCELQNARKTRPIAAGFMIKVENFESLLIKQTDLFLKSHLLEKYSGVM